MDLSGEDLPGEEILALLHRAEGDTIAAAMTGTTFYVDDPDAPQPILSCDRERGTIRIAGTGGQSRNVALSRGYVLLTDGLRAAIAALRTPADEQADRDRQALAAFGFCANVETQDRPALLAAIAAAREFRTPFRDDRFEGLRLARKYGSAREEIRLVDAWLAGASDPPPGDLVIAGVGSLRDSGRITEALERTELLTRPANGLSARERQILFVQRGAILLDLHEVNAAPELLERAEQCAKRSWAIGPTEECSELYQRLRKQSDRAF